MKYAQYWEDDFLLPYFKDKGVGFLVDVGAADGQTGSNSRCLLLQGWKGILIEPEPTQFAALQELYKDNKNVVTVNCAIGHTHGRYPFYSCAQVSTLCPKWKENCEGRFGVEYQTGEVEVRTLTSVLEEFKAPLELDFLTIDAEGMDGTVWHSLDSTRFRTKLVCMEGHGWALPAYKEVHRTAGNILLELQ